MAAPGFQNFEGALTVSVQQDAVVDGTLTLGQTVTQVEVKDVTPMVRVDSPTLGHVLERQRIEQLPMNGRGYQTLLATVPGIDSTGHSAGHTECAPTQRHAVRRHAGERDYEGWDFARPPGLDPSQEMQVEVNNSSAKFTAADDDHSVEQEAAPTSFTAHCSRPTGTAATAWPGAGRTTSRKPPYPEPQRVRRFRRRAGVSSPRSTTAATGRSSTSPGKESRNLSYTTQQCWRCRPRPCATATSAAWWTLRRQYQPLRPADHQPDDLGAAAADLRGVANTIDPARLSPTGQVSVRHHAAAESARASTR